MSPLPDPDRRRAVTFSAIALALSGLVGVLPWVAVAGVVLLGSGRLLLTRPSEGQVAGAHSSR